MKVFDKPKIPMFADLLEELRDGKEITRLQGSLNASICLIAPQPSKDEVEANLCWVNRNAQVFFSLTESLVDLGPDDFLIFPTTFNGEKPVKSNTELPKRFLKRASQFKQIRRFVCIGSDAFKVFFGMGKKPSMSMLTGRTLYVAETAFKPLMVMPDPNLTMPLEKIVDKREYSIRRRQVDNNIALYERILTTRFPSFLKTDGSGEEESHAKFYRPKK